MNERNPNISTATEATPLPASSPPAGRLGRWVRQQNVTVLAVGAVAVVVVLVVLGVVVSRGWGSNPDGLDIDGLPTARVQRGPMSVTITDSGEVVADQQQIIKNDLRWPAIIESIAPEGEMVKKDELLIGFRCEELMDAIEEQRMVVQAADDKHITAVTNLELKQMEMESRVRNVEQGLADAKADLEKYQEAEWLQQRDEAKADIQLAQGDLKLAEHKLASKLEINENPELNKPYSQNEIDAEKLTVERLTIALHGAETEEGILLDYTHPRAIRDKNTAVQDAELDVRSTKAERDKQLKLASSALELATHRSKQEKEKFDKYIEDRDQRLTVVAKEPGLVVYETRRRGWHRPITVAVGEEINPNQQVMIIPDLNTLVFKTQVYEAIHEQVHVGLRARIRLDARRGEVLYGKVSKVAALPDSQNPWLSPGVKVYPTTVSFDQDVRELQLKPGMTGDVEITLAELNDALTVPIAAVFSEDETTFCYRVGGGGRAERVEVKVGLSNSERAQILTGLDESDRVLLVLPPGARSQRKPTEKKVQELPQPPPAAAPGAGEKVGRRGPPAGTTRPAGAPTDRRTSGRRGPRGGDRPHP